MKKIWKIRKDSEAVSPVIATILMVAITVVLAAVLYVMVMGFGTGGNTAPTGSFTNVQKATSTSEKMFFGPFNKDVKPSDIKIVVENQSAAQSSTYTLPATDLSGNLALVAGGTPVTGISTTTPPAYTDLAGDKKISNQDYITITFTFSGSGSLSYKVSMIYVPTGDSVGSITFSW
jgi:flagellin-like protein